jgi:hypothetical protein
LPEYYLKNISHIIIPIEMVVRVILMALSTIMIIDIIVLSILFGIIHTYHGYILLAK